MHLQLTYSSPIFRPAGLMKRVRVLLSRIGFPSLTDWKAKLSGLEDLTAGNRLVPVPFLNEMVSDFKRVIRVGAFPD
jgi:hypothetical protein